MILYSQMCVTPEVLTKVVPPLPVFGPSPSDMENIARSWRGLSTHYDRYCPVLENALVTGTQASPFSWKTRRSRSAARIQPLPLTP